MHPQTRFWLKTSSDWLVRFGGVLAGVAITFGVLRSPFDWGWVAIGVAGIFSVAAGIVLVRYIPYGDDE